MITSILYKATRDEVQFIFIDPKRIELGVYADIPHLKTEVVVEPKKAANALRWAVAEMERRYRLLAEVHVRSIDFYNRAIRDPEVQQRLSLTEGGEQRLPARGPQAAALLRDRHRRARRPDDGLLGRGRDRDRAPGADGARGRHPPDRRHPAAVGRHPHRHHQGELPLPHLVRHRLAPRLAHHPRPGRLREAARQGRHAVHAAGHLAADAPARRLHQRAGDRGAGALAQEAGQAAARPDGARGRPRPSARPPTAATTTTSSSTRPRAWW